MRYLLPVSLVAALALISQSAAIAAAELKVEVRLTGIESETLRQTTRTLSDLSVKNTSYTATTQIRRTAQTDADRMQAYLQSQGYYAAQVEPRIRRTGLTVDVIFSIELGPAFTVDNYTIQYLDSQTDPRPQDFDVIGGADKSAPTGEYLATLGTEFIAHLWDNGYPSASLTRQAVEANFGKATATALYQIETGPKAQYGNIRFDGNQRTRDDFLKKYFVPSVGETYSRQDVDKFRARLASTGLFSEISIQPAAPSQDGTTDLLVNLEERKHRTVAIGLSFATDVGPGATASWENRNLFGGAERLITELALSAPEQTFEVTLEEPMPRLPGSWTSSLLLESEITDAFEAISGTLGTGLTKTFLNSNWEIGGGIQYTFSDIIDLSDPNFPRGVEETFQSVSFPLVTKFNNENDALNPTSGHRFRAEITPHIGDKQFNRMQISGASRIDFGATDRFLFASRLRFGATLGASGNSLPATERFFSGGGGSVRGYAYQEAGPIDTETGNATGGASVSELNLEARYHVTEKIQIALFADGGSVYESETPDFRGDFLVGAGIGVRYLTPVGPIRLDVATPLDRREISALRPNENGDLELQTVFEDDPVHIYIALGQPF